MKSYFYFLSLIFIIPAYATYAQIGAVQFRICNECGSGNDPDQDYTYGTLTPMPVNPSVTEDFGPRKLNGGYQFHGGLDLNTQTGDGDLGDAIMSIHNGHIVGVYLNGSLKTVVTEDNAGNLLGYRHVFNSAAIANNQTSYIRNGDIIMKRRKDDQSEFAILFLDEPTIRAVSTYNSGVVTWDGVDYSTINSITSVQTIVPLGMSGTSEAHLHLSSYNSLLPFATNANDSDANAKSPLYCIGNYPKPNWTVENMLTLHYGNIPSKAIIQLNMSGEGVNANRYDVICDNNIVDFRVASVGSSPTQAQPILGGGSLGYISSGGRPTGVVKATAVWVINSRVWCTRDVCSSCAENPKAGEGRLSALNGTNLKNIINVIRVSKDHSRFGHGYDTKSGTEDQGYGGRILFEYLIFP